MRIKPTYFTIGIRERKYKRIFFIQEVRTKNLFFYAHKIHNLVFDSEEETEKAILEKIKSKLDEYTDRKGRVFRGKIPPRHYKQLRFAR